MTRFQGLCRTSWFAGAVVVALVGVTAVAAEKARKPKHGEYNPADASVEMFQAIEDGQIEVKLIPKDSTLCRVVVTNKTDKPLNVKLPEAFAGVPALAQFGVPAGGGGAFGPAGGGGPIGGGGGRRGGGGLGGSSGSQGFGGGMGGMGGMGMGGMGFMNIAPEKVGQLKVPVVCLEHGKRDPNPAIPYVIKPIDSFTDKPAVHELCRMLGTGQLNQRVAQAAAWHLNNDMSWQELASKTLRSANGLVRPYFHAQEIQAGARIAEQAAAAAKARREESSPGNADSLGQR
ncbi:MAG: hypothetical protein JW809_04665 [Pirellulales bacterium]|nr:hypothetical protein [Pirellulales bacterium]